MEIVALIPAFNEAERIEATVRAVSGIASISRIIVVDDGSDDDTALLARHAGASVLQHSTNAGKGAALDAGLAYARSEGDVDIVALVDADLAETASQVELLLDPVVIDNADMTIARFPRPAGKAGFGLVKGLARWGIRTVGRSDFDAQAPLSGQRVLNADALAACTPFAGGYGVEVALSVRALRAGLRISEVETTMSHAATGRDLAGFRHRGRQFAHVLATLARLSVERDTPTLRQ